MPSMTELKTVFIVKPNGERTAIRHSEAVSGDIVDARDIARRHGLDDGDCSGTTRTHIHIMMFVVVREDATETIFIFGDAHELEVTERLFGLISAEEILQNLIVGDIKAYSVGHVIGFATHFKGNDFIGPIDEGLGDIAEIVGSIGERDARSDGREPKEPNSAENTRQQLHLNFHTILRIVGTRRELAFTSPAQAWA